MPPLVATEQHQNDRQDESSTGETAHNATNDLGGVKRRRSTGIRVTSGGSICTGRCGGCTRSTAVSPIIEG